MKRRKRTIWLVALALVLAVAGGGAYYALKMRPAAAQPQAQSSVRTTRAFRGDLVISATGAGTVIAVAEARLGFQPSGTLVELAVQVGDAVKAGDVLARVDDLEARKAVSSAESQMLNATTQLATARQNHADLLAGTAEADLLQARAAVLAAEKALADLEAGPTDAQIVAAQAAVSSAQEAYERLVNGPTADELTRQELQLAQSRNSLWAAQLNRDARGNDRDKASGSYDQAQASVLNSEISVQLAEMALADLRVSPSQAQLQAAQAQLASSRQALADLRAGPSEADIARAKADLTKAQDALDALTAGPTEETLAASEAALRQAELGLGLAEMNLESAQLNLENTTLIAPVDGTVIAVSAAVGESVGGGFITLARAGQPRIEVLLDQSDMDRVAVGYEAEVVLEAKPDETFLGTVVQVDPSLVTMSGVQAVRALVELSAESFTKPQNLLLGMTATVDIIGGRAEGAVLVPVEALREIDRGQYAVFVMEDGTLRMRQVEVGLMDLSYAQIASGLAVGETISTGMVEVR